MKLKVGFFSTNTCQVDFAIYVLDKGDFPHEKIFPYAPNGEIVSLNGQARTYVGSALSAEIASAEAKKRLQQVELLLTKLRGQPLPKDYEVVL